jgi:hypothetical protein
MYGILLLLSIVLLFAGGVDIVGKNEERISFRRTDGTCVGDTISITG